MARQPPKAIGGWKTKVWGKFPSRWRQGGLETASPALGDFAIFQ